MDLLKRGFDASLALFGLALLWPVLALIAIRIRLSDGAPVIFSQPRVGRFGKPFLIHKFRSMVTDAPRLGSSVTAAGDTRVTPTGRLLRRFKLDELPQLWNVLKGDMSLVGPRPIRPRFFEELAEELPAYWQRLVVRPGLTGFAQVRRGYETSMVEKLAHDLEWIADRSVRLYLRTLGATAWRLLRQVLHVKS